MKKILISTLLLMTLVSCGAEEEKIVEPITDIPEVNEFVPEDQKIREDREELAREQAEQDIIQAEYDKKVEVILEAQYEREIKADHVEEIAESEAYIAAERKAYKIELLTADADRVIVINRKLQILDETQQELNNL